MIRRLILAALFVPAFAFAQEDIDMSAGVPGMNMRVQVKDGSRRSNTTVKTTSHEEASGDGYRIAWDTDPDGDTWFKVLSPEGAQIRVLDDVNFPKASGTIPVSFRASGKKFYQVEIRMQGATFVKKFEAKDGMVAQLWVGGPSGSVQMQAPPVAAAGPCGSEGDLKEASAAIAEESFSSGKLRVLGDVASSRGFCVDHVVVLLRLFDFEADRLSALKLLAPKITDKQNKFKVYKAFDFDGSRDEAKKILK